MELVYHEKAASDLDHIWTYVEVHSGANVADDLVTRLNETLWSTVARQPRSGSQRPEFGADVRSFPIIPYVAFYEIEAKRVIVLRILHGRRDLRQPLMSLIAAS
ncbi:MAG TPA: type II toxin-antitoxin system RelE/ParE family toxin [Candidatus Baltobacteraceae bacterium]